MSVNWKGDGCNFEVYIVVVVAQRIKYLLQSKTCRFSPWARKIPWRREWRLTLVFLPGKSHGQTSLAG